MGKPYCCLYDQNRVLPQPQSPPSTCAQVKGTATISTFNRVLKSMAQPQSPPSNLCVCLCQCLVVPQPQSPPSDVCVCSCQCLEVEEWEDLLGTITGTATTSTFKPVCVLMSMLGGATISTLKHLCVCSCQCLEVEEWEDLLGTIKERRSSFLNRTSRSTEVSACS